MKNAVEGEDFFFSHPYGPPGVKIPLLEKTLIQNIGEKC